MLAKLSIDQALMKANSHLKRDEILEAQKLYQAVLLAFPKNIRAQQGLANLNKFKLTNTNKNPSKETINHLINLYNQGQLSSVIEQAQELSVKFPGSFDIWNILGTSAIQIKMFDKAIEAYKKCVILKPDYAEGYNNMGVALKEQGKFLEAINFYKKSISLKPDFAEAYVNIGVAFKALGKLDDSIDAYNKSITIKPDYADAYTNMGTVLRQKGMLNEAIDAYQKSISIKPNNVVALINMGNAFKLLGKVEKTIEAYNKVLILQPDNETIRAHKLREQAKICDWNEIEKDRELIPKLGTLNNSIHPLAMLSVEDSPIRHLLRSKIYAKEKFSKKTSPLFVKPKNNKERIRIGYFSSDFREHPVGYLIAKVIEKHDRNKFEIFAYSLISNKKDELQKRFTKSFDVFNDVSGMSDEEIVLLSRNQNIDIAIDLNGYTKDNRSSIFSYRVAPIQINFLGFPGTMGTDFIDYIISDQHVIPLNKKKYYTEKKIYLPYTYMPTDNTRELSKKSISRSDMGLPDEAFVFCCFNTNYKITCIEFDIWMRLLCKVKGSVIWLRRSNSISEKNIIKEAKKRNIDTSRLVFADKVPMDVHLARYKLADLFLDTFNFNAHTTATEALWAGLPVITKQGESFAARVASSLLNAIGLKELVLKTESEYEEMILELSTNLSKLTAIKKKLVANRLSKPLFDTKLYTKYLENGYLKVYQNYIDQKNPETIFIPK